MHFPKKGSQVRIHYIAALKIDGVTKEPFDNSRTRKQPLVARLGAGVLISGVEAALLTMSKGTLAKVTVPSSKAYGQRGYPPIVPPDSVIEYELELLALE